jgi:predicted alpha/beta-fold hydrolase
LSAFINFGMTFPIKAQILSQWEWFRSPAVKAKGVRLADLIVARSLREVEQAVICPLHGYATPEIYYESSNPLPVLRYVAVPLLILNAKDDPLVYSSQLGMQKSREQIRGRGGRDSNSSNNSSNSGNSGNPWIILAETAHGGHLGWTGSGGVNFNAEGRGIGIGSGSSAMAGICSPFLALQSSWADTTVLEYFEYHHHHQQQQQQQQQQSAAGVGVGTADQKQALRQGQGPKSRL